MGFFSDIGDALSGAVSSIGGFLSGDAGMQMMTGLGTGGLSLLGGIMQSNQAEKNAQKQMDFQERMSSTAHQREVADLRAAGLNPILSVNHGGASSPAGSSAPAYDYVSPAINSALQAFKLGIDSGKTLKETTMIVPQALSQVEKNYADANSARTLTNLNQENIDNAILQRDLIKEQTKQTKIMSEFLKSQNVNEKIQSDILSQNKVVATAAAKRALTEGQIDDSAYGRIMRYVDRFASSASPFIPRSHLNVNDLRRSH